MTGAKKKREVRAFMAEAGTNGTTALRAFDAATGHHYAKSDATEPKFLGTSEPVHARESAPPAAVDTTLNLQFSHLWMSTGPAELTVGLQAPDSPKTFYDVWSCLAADVHLSP